MSQTFRLFDLRPIQQNQSFTLDADAHHIVSRVLRMVEGDQVEILNGQGMIAQATIASMKPKASVTIREISQHTKPTPSIEMYVGMLKGEKLSLLIQKAVELGVDRFFLIQTDHSVSIKSEAFLEKCEKTAVEAIRQSGNPFLPKFELLSGVEKIQWNQNSNHWNLVLDEKKNAMPFSQLLNQPAPKSLSLFVGPEGSFSEHERKLFTDNQCRFVSIAPYVLRSETAAIAAIATCRASLNFEE